MKPLILAVDDNKAMRFLLHTIFKKKYNVVTAADAASAMYWLSKKNFPDVILADAKLSDVEEWEFIENLKNSFLYKEIPIVVLSSLGIENTKMQCSKYKVEEYFLKPFNPEFLLKTIEVFTSVRKTIANQKNVTI